VNVAFGLGVGMTVLAALLFPVWATVLGFGSARWVGADRAAGMRRSTAEVRAPGATQADAGPPPPLPGTAAHAWAPAAPSSMPPVPPVPSAPASDEAPREAGAPAASDAADEPISF